MLSKLVIFQCSKFIQNFINSFNILLNKSVFGGKFDIVFKGVPLVQFFGELVCGAINYSLECSVISNGRND